MEIIAVDSDDDRATLQVLLVAYHEWMAEHAGEIYDSMLALTEDMRSLTHEPDSWAWIARVEGEQAGCVLLYRETDDLAEFKRLYVRPGYRGMGVGRALTRTVATRAKELGCATLGLTTPPWSDAAHALYDSMGFERTPPYPETRLPEQYHDEAIFMQLDLTASATNRPCGS